MGDEMRPKPVLKSYFVRHVLLKVNTEVSKRGIILFLLVRSLPQNTDRILPPKQTD